MEVLFIDVDEWNNYEKWSFFDNCIGIAVMMGIMTLRICFYIITMMFVYLASEPNFASYRILKEGFIFETITYVFLYFTLSIVGQSFKHFGQ
jgi:hypothetical protein